ncbi:MAG: phospholipid-binding protein MlaC [Candidatus Symbiodolus clandestinus]
MTLTSYPLFFRALFSGCSLLWLVATWPLRCQALITSNPYQLMHQVAEQTFQRLRSEQSTIAQDPNYLRVVARQELMPFVHTRYIGALILGPLFTTLETSQQQDYFQILETYLEYNCAQLLARCHNHRYQIEAEKPFENRSLVAVRLYLLQQAANPLRVDFKWRKNSKSQQWQLYDILVEGVSLIMTERQEWSSLFRQSGFDALIKQLQSDAKQPIQLPS